MQRIVSKGIGTNWWMEQRGDDIAQKIRGSQKNTICALDIEHTLTPQRTQESKHILRAQYCTRTCAYREEKNLLH